MSKIIGSNFGRVKNDKWLSKVKLPDRWKIWIDISGSLVEVGCKSSSDGFSPKKNTNSLIQYQNQQMLQKQRC
jgi:hypothetical protein